MSFRNLLNGANAKVAHPQIFEPLCSLKSTNNWTCSATVNASRCTVIAGNLWRRGLHGLINRAVERFARDTYGDAFWASVAQSAELGFTSFEAMLVYERQTTDRVVNALAEALGKGRDDVLEDVGTYLVASPKTEALRRLLRFGGTDFVEFLNSLDELPARTRLAVPDLPMPQIELREVDQQTFMLSVQSSTGTDGLFGHVLLGLLRAMADDYGALVFMNLEPGETGRDIIEIILLEVAFAEAREFELGVKSG